jgi:multiple sugar transport system permease protein
LPSARAFGSRKKKILRENLEAYAYIAPAALIIFAFWVFPVLLSVIVSLRNWRMLDTFETTHWVGLTNYIRALSDDQFIKVLYNTLNYVLWSVPATLAVSLAVAMLLNSRLRFRSAFRTTYFLPYITTWVAISIVWRYFYQPQFGLGNLILLNYLHLGELQWLLEPRGIVEMLLSALGIHVKNPLLAGPSLAMFSVIMTSIWRDIGFFMIIFLAGLQNIDVTYYEAADIDGATAWQKFRYITFPLLSPVTFFLLIISMISAWKVFVPMFIMTPEGGPDNTTATVVYYLWDKGFRGTGLLGYAAAIAYILFLIILILTIIQNVVFGKRVQYGD